jgi:nicotinamide riboside kinase
MEKGFKRTKLKTKSKTIIITGAESTGKSILTNGLATHFRLPFIPEFARNYIENLGRKYNYDDVVLIAKKQIQELNEFQQKNLPWIFSDTWLIITKIWFEEVFGKVPGWLDIEIKKTNIDLFLVCDTDLPWEPDPVRENGGEKRLYLQQKYIETINNYGFNYKIISGKDETRLQNALNHLKQMELQ